MTSSSPRSAFITGGASGMGRATALELASRGTAVTLFDLNPAGLEETKSLVEAAGGSAVVYAGDVTSLDDLTAAAAAGAAAFGGIDAAAACAGIEVIKPFLETSIEEWNRCLNIDLTGVMLTARVTIPYMLEGGKGSIVAVASDCGTHGYPDWTAYCAAKHGVVGLIKALALEFGARGIRSNVVTPGWIITPMHERILEGVSAEERAEAAKGNPMGRFAQASEVATVLAHLLSDEASYTNGLVYPIDGGTTAGFLE
ncbi:SDR family oxidoreductase [Microbacterium sp. X-17]|uniref:SDR family NAD(P)-dependent oxidoreductase n=1 Tax=Microbacterium sp. X-17 TaxID=3144404 RepID=UPI0031F5D366